MNASARLIANNGEIVAICHVLKPSINKSFLHQITAPCSSAKKILNTNLLRDTGIAMGAGVGRHSQAVADQLPADRESAIRHFHKFDVQKHGYLNKEELNVAIEALGWRLEEDHIQEVICKMDTNEVCQIAFFFFGFQLIIDPFSGWCCGFR